MSTMHKYDEWLDSFYGLKPHRSKHDESFNNILFSTELIMAKLALKNLTQEDLSLYLGHIHLMDTPEGLYAPKNSHDNLTAKITGLIALDSGKTRDIKLSHANEGKHPRDRILYGFWLSGNIFYKLLLPLALLDMVRAILSSGKIRPKFWDLKYTWLRIRVMLGLAKKVREESILGGRAEFYEHAGRVERVIYVQNDGKILNLLRLNALRKHSILKPFVRFCKKLYIKKLGKNFQSVLFANYFEEPDHPVRVAYGELDKLGKTIIDC